MGFALATILGSLAIVPAANAAVMADVADAGIGTNVGMNFNSIPASTNANAQSPIVIGDWTFTNSTQPVQVNVDGSSNGAQPFGTSGNYLSVLGSGSEDVSFSARSSFSFFWGSIDDFNTLVVHTLGGANYTFTGTTIAAQFAAEGVKANGCQNLTDCNRYFTFTADPGEQITGFSMSSSSNSFEITNISAVPEPTTWAMMILGFLGLGFLGYRKSAKSSTNAFRIA
ncbi:PEP-CTERM sorting domain-containing protein [Bradyrhizobium lablabi]|uniref:Npun_F0296 family exosortase-dependent surface protein n=1 Tax=Bradyrhizobium lablabi TaxID=722472 RepID=UPI001BAC9002|nr:PEP-CTERM sorting domain-containing protein [Bradyrhizobium lablabi]MBR0697805.1 PEP-CTERM sorting domain-containing protein [Bradyrhizobium lablabi]